MADAESRQGPIEGPVRCACDQCHTRKVKCDGADPCVTCQRTDALCSFLKPVMPKGPVPKTRHYRREASSTMGRATRSSSPVRSQRLGSFEKTAAVPSSLASGSLSRTWSPEGWPAGSWGTAGIAGFGVLRPAPEGSQSKPVSTPRRPIVETKDNALPLPLAQQSIPDATGTSYFPFLDEIFAFAPPWQDSNADSDDLNTGGKGVAVTLPSTAVATYAREPSPSMSFLDAIFGSSTNPTAARPSAADPSWTSPWSLPFAPPEDVSPIYTLTLDTLIKPQLQVFFDRVYPMLPVFSRSYIMSRLDDPDSQQNRTFVSLVLSMCALSLVHPLRSDELSSQTTRAKQCKTLMDEALRMCSRWDWGITPKVQAATASYMMFGALFELGYAEGARMKLREALGMGEALSLASTKGYVGVEPDEARRRLRLFWVLSVTERAYALQRSGGITFPGSLFPESTGLEPAIDPSAGTLYYLARLFSLVDADIISCWNKQCTPSSCRKLTAERAVTILRTLGGSMSQVFGVQVDFTGLSEVQKADLLITWQWLRNRIWRLAVGHGLMKEDTGAEKELGIEYVVDVASTTVAICQRLSRGAMEAHGCGFVEKLYDIASIITEVGQACPQLESRFTAVAWSDRWMDLLQSLYQFVAQHRAGVGFSKPLNEAMSLVSIGKILSVDL